MLGKLSKYLFLIGFVSMLSVLIFDLGLKVMMFASFCIMFSFLAFLGWLIDGPIVVVVKDDKDR